MSREADGNKTTSKIRRIRIAEVVFEGELNGLSKGEDSTAILERCGRLLDKSCADSILGEVLFKTDDGTYYTVTVEAVIGTAAPWWVKEKLAERADKSRTIGKEK